MPHPVIQKEVKAEASERADSADDPLFSLRVTDRNVHEKHRKKMPQLDLSVVTGHAPTPEPQFKEKVNAGEKKANEVSNIMHTSSYYEHATEE